MKTNIAILVKNAKPGKNKNWIVLEAYVGFFDVNKLYRIEFCGTEAISSIPLLDNQNDQLIELLANDYGYGPYNLSKVKETIGEGKQYIIVR